jgi:hypothetical protein
LGKVTVDGREITPERNCREFPGMIVDVVDREMVITAVPSKEHEEPVIRFRLVVVNRLEQGTTRPAEELVPKMAMEVLKKIWTDAAEVVKAANETIGANWK